MRINIKSITDAIARVSAMTIGDKQIPLAMIDSTETAETQKIKLCFYDGHKAYIESIDVVTEEGDLFKKLVVSITDLQRAIGNCQPSSKRKIDEVVLQFDNNIIKITADQYMDVVDNDGNVVETRHMGVKSMKISWSETDKDIKTKLVDRMDYTTIFDDAVVADEYDCNELSTALSKTSIESAKLTYIGKNTQSVFVQNTAHVTSVPISGNEVTLEDEDIIRGELTSAGTYTDEAFAKAVADRRNRIHFSVTLNDNLCKSLISVINKSGAEKLNLFTKDGKYCHINIALDNDNFIGIWFEMPQGSKQNIGAFDRFNGLAYDKYQLDFVNEFLSDNIKSALAVSGSDKVAFKFEETDAGTTLLISPSNAMANVDDKYTVVAEQVVDVDSSLVGNSFNISLKVFSEMLSQISTDIVALDFQVQPDGTVCIRLSEVDMSKMMSAYEKMREDTKNICEQQGVEFDPANTPTAATARIAHRREVLGTQQFTTLAK